MSVRRKSLQGSFVLTIGEAVIYGSSFMRNMILARVLTKTDFGIASAFAMIITLIEFSAKLGISRFVIRDQEGDQPEFLATAHFVQAMASLLSSILMISAAWPIAQLFDIAEHISALFWLALIPLLHGLNHLDVKRFERDLRFGPSTSVEMIPQVVITLAAWPVATWLRDYRAVVVLLLVKAASSLIGSHWMAKQPYRWRLNREYILRMLRFGWPLVVTGFLMFGVMQGDQFLVASFYTMSDLAPYAAAAALTMAPTFFFGRVFNSIALPIMAKVQDDPVTFERRYRLIIAIICAFSATYVVGVIIGAEAIMQVVYGKKYAGAGVILGWLAAANAFRNIRIAPAIAAISRGDSKNQMVSNMARVLTLIPAFGVALAGQPIWMIACIGVLGESLACFVSFRRLTNRDGIPMARSIYPTMLVLGAVVLAGLFSYLGGYSFTPILSLSFAAGGVVLAGIAIVMMLPDLRREVTRLIHTVRAAGLRGSLSKLMAPKVVPRAGPAAAAR